MIHACYAFTVFSSQPCFFIMSKYAKQQCLAHSLILFVINEDPKIMLGTIRTKDVNKKRNKEVTIQYNHSATILSNTPSVLPALHPV